MNSKHSSEVDVDYDDIAVSNNIFPVVIKEAHLEEVSKSTIDVTELKVLQSSDTNLAG